MADAAEPVSEYLERAQGLAPLIEASADQAERERRLPEPVVTALVAAGLFRMLLPRSLGGGEVDPVTFVRVVEEIAKTDASTAWVLCQASGCSMVAAYLDPDAAQQIFGRDPRAMLIWGPGPTARAIVKNNGYLVSGTWSFGSGSRHATWLGGYCPIYEADGTPRRQADGAHEGRTMLFPAERARMIDVWNVIGLKATGSDSFSVAELFVLREHTVARDDPKERRSPGLLYCFPTGSMYASGFAGVALGIARSILDALVALARDKTPRGHAQPLRESAVTQSQVAQAEARLGSARTFLLGSLEEIWRAVGRAGALSLDQRVRIRLAATWAIQQAREVVDFAYHAAGSTSIFEGGAFERRFRDLHAVAQQLQGRQAHFETVGRFMLGLEPDTSFL